jgi:sulfate adenylyltransferase
LYDGHVLYGDSVFTKLRPQEGSVRADDRLRPVPGVAVWLTGLPASGKTTIALALKELLLARGGQDVVILDGDVVRSSINPQLGFSREDREKQMERVTCVALDVVRRGGVAICALVAPYDAARRKARSRIEVDGAFVLVYVSTPLAICETRDPKGLYTRARNGAITQFTGVSDPYEAPSDANIKVDTSAETGEDIAAQILSALPLTSYGD